MIKDLFKFQQHFEHDIFGSPAISEEQAIEIRLRESVANETYNDYLLEVSHHHSIPVMDSEVIKFLKQIPQGGLVCDVGGCWGWHWRNIQILRPDIKVVIVDFVRSNLLHARTLLKDMIGRNIYLVHGDAISLQFRNSVFDGYWTVQTFQHIPNLKSAIDEAHRILKPGGTFVDYALNNSPIFKLAFSVAGKAYVENGLVNNNFYLRRAAEIERRLLEDKFRTKVISSYSEILFKPEIKFTWPGRVSSVLGHMDAQLTGGNLIAKYLGRQRCYMVTKSRDIRCEDSCIH